MKNWKRLINAILNLLTQILGGQYFTLFIFVKGITNMIGNGMVGAAKGQKKTKTKNASSLDTFS